MNYRHVYHAGNHADVLKHIVMMRALVHLKKKDNLSCFSIRMRESGSTRCGPTRR